MVVIGAPKTMWLNDASINLQQLKEALTGLSIILGSGRTTAADWDLNLNLPLSSTLITTLNNNT